MNKKNKNAEVELKEDGTPNIINELLQLKFKNLDDLNDDAVVEYLYNIYLDLTDIFEDSEDVPTPNKKNIKKEDDDDISLPSSDSGPTPVELKSQEKNSENINFIISKKKTELIDFECSSCHDKTNLALNLFSKNQFVNHTCPNCLSKILLKIDFKTNILKYKEEI